MSLSGGSRSAVSAARGGELDPQVADLIRLASTQLVAPPDPTPDDRRALAGVVSELFRGPVDPAEFVAITVTAQTVVSQDGAEVLVQTYSPVQRASGVSILYIHGGGWVAGSTESYDPEIRRLVSVTGLPVSSVDYRLSPEHQRPAAVEDCIAAARSIIDDGETDYLAIAGDSAGGQLALECATRLTREGVDLAATLLLYPVVDPSAQGNVSYRENGTDYMLVEEDMAFYWRSYLGPDNHSSLVDEPLFSIGDLRGMPPTVIVTAGFDPLRDEGRRLAADLIEADVPVVYLPNPTLTHGFQQMVPRVDAAKRAVHDAYLAFREAADSAGRHE